jgi:UDP-glucose 4-epimerase
VSGAPVFYLDLAEVGASDRLATIMAENAVTAVVHLAGRKRVEESVARPLFYYNQNTQSVLNVVRAMNRCAVRNLVFSSSAAVYGSVEGDDVTEDAETAPLSPYGSSKLVGEWALRDSAVAHGLRVISLRYFNVAGSGAEGLKDLGKFNLIPIVLSRLRSGVPPLIHGADYPTADGTCVRDYIHVVDLADAHVAALLDLENGVDGHRVYNVGTGKGTSVKEIVSLASNFLSSSVEAQVGPRRLGDAARVVANVALIERELGWKAIRNVREMIGSA